MTYDDEKTNITSMDSGPVVPRLLDLEKLLSQKSHFLFGPRQTGKTFIIRSEILIESGSTSNNKTSSVPDISPAGAGHALIVNIDAVKVFPLRALAEIAPTLSLQHPEIFRFAVSFLEFLCGHEIILQKY
jgi:hypothetical protein